MTSTKTRFDRNSTRKNTSIQKPEEPKNYNPAYILSIFSKERGLINQSASEFKTYSKKKKKKQRKSSGWDDTSRVSRYFRFPSSAGMAPSCFPESCLCKNTT